MQTIQLFLVVVLVAVSVLWAETDSALVSDTLAVPLLVSDTGSLILRDTSTILSVKEVEPRGFKGQVLRWKTHALLYYQEHKRQCQIGGGAVLGLVVSLALLSGGDASGDGPGGNGSLGGKEIGPPNFPPPGFQ